MMEYKKNKSIVKNEFYSNCIDNDLEIYQEWIM